MNKVQKITKQQSSTSAEELFRFDGTSKITETEPIEGTPFTAIRMGDLWFISWGGHLLSKQIETKEQCKQYLETNKWDIIAVFTLAVMAKKELAELSTKKEKSITKKSKK